VQRRPEGIEARQAELANDHRLVRKGTAGAAVLLGDRGAKQSGGARPGPHVAVIHSFLVPGLELWRIFGRDEASRLLLEQHDVLGHPARKRKIERAHDCPADAVYRPPAWDARAAGRARFERCLVAVRVLAIASDRTID